MIGRCGRRRRSAFGLGVFVVGVDADPDAPRRALVGGLVGARHFLRQAMVQSAPALPHELVNALAVLERDATGEHRSLEQGRSCAEGVRHAGQQVVARVVAQEGEHLLQVVRGNEAGCGEFDAAIAFAHHAEAHQFVEDGAMVHVAAAGAPGERLERGLGCPRPRSATSAAAGSSANICSHSVIVFASADISDFGRLIRGLPHLARDRLAVQAGRHRQLADVRLGALLEPGAARLVEQDVAQQFFQMRMLDAEGQGQPHQRSKHTRASRRAPRPTALACSGRSLPEADRRPRSCLAFFDPVGWVPMAPIGPLYSVDEPGSLPSGVGNPRVVDLIGKHFVTTSIGTGAA